MSINSFGYGGANAHCILDGAESIIPGYRLSGHALTSPLRSLNGGLTNGRRLLSESSSDDESDNDSLDTLEELFPKQVTKGDVPAPANAQPDSTENTDASALKSPEKIKAKLSAQESTSGALLGMENAPSRRKIFLPVSGHGEDSLKANIESTLGAINDFVLADVTYTLTTRRSMFSHRGFAIADTTSGKVEIDEDSFTTGKSGSTRLSRIGFVFTGQGAQWPHMGRELIDEFEVFRSSIRYQDYVLTQLPNPPTWSIEELLTEPSMAERINEPQFSQTICTALQVAVVALLKSWDIQPVATVGHSSGEIAAAYAAGYHTAAESITLAYLRGQTVSRNKQKGCMLATGLSAEDVKPHLSGYEKTIRIAAVNSPENVTLSGDEEATSSLKKSLDDAGVFVRALKTSGNAYHSHHMAALGEGYEDAAHEALSKISHLISAEELNSSSVVWQSSVMPLKEIERGAVAASYWRKNLESPVLFSDAVQHMVKNESNALDLLLEIGPHPALAGPLKQIRVALQKDSITMPAYLGTIIRGKDALESMLSLAGNMFLQNASMNFTAVNATDKVYNGEQRRVHGCLCIDWPNYSYNYGDIIYHENRINREWRLRKHPRHDLLGGRQPGVARTKPSWRNMLRLKDVPWLDDHKLLPNPIFPGAGYLAMAIEAASQLHQEPENAPPITGFTLRSVAINSTLQIPENEIGVEIILNMNLVPLTTQKESSIWYEFAISSESPESRTWSINCSGRICVETEKKEVEPNFQPTKQFKAVQSDRWYEKFAEVGLGYGPAFQGLSEIKAFADDNQVTANLALKPTAGMMKAESAYTIHPATLDTSLQLALMAFHGGQVELPKYAHVPIGIAEMTVWTPSTDNTEDSENPVGYGYATGNLKGVRDAFGDTQIFLKSGEPFLDMRQLRCVAYEGSASEESVPVAREPFMRMVWKPCIDALSKEQGTEIFPAETSVKDLSSTLDKLDRLTSYILVDISKKSYDVEDDAADHLRSFLSWVDRSVESDAMPFMKEALAAKPQDRSEIVTKLFTELSDVAEAKVIKQVYENLPSILDGSKSGSEVVLEDDLLAGVYISGISVSAAYTQLQRVLDLAAHKAPRMKVLELGAGFGGATRAALTALEGNKGCKRYQSYTFTELSTSFFDKAKSELEGHSGLVFKQLDIEKDPLEQEFEAEYDLVIASQILHTTKDLAQSIQHARSLLKPGGKLILLELTRAPMCSSLILGTLPGYWSIRSNEEGEPLKSKDQWSELFSQNGFSGADLTLDDYSSKESMASVIVTTATASPEDAQNVEAEAFILYDKSIPPFAKALEEQLRAQKVSSKSIALSDAAKIPDGSRVISVVELSGKTFNRFDSAEFELMKNLLHRAASLTWVSAGGLVEGLKPEAAIMVGILRTMAKEASSVKFMSIDIGTADHNANLAKMVALREESLHASNEYFAWDNEFAYYDGLLQVSRLVPDRVLNGEFDARENATSNMEMLPIGETPPLGVNYEQPGLLSSLYFNVDPEFDTPLKDNWVEIKSGAMGLNVKDLAVATGRFAWHKFSTECAGTIVKVGKNVKDLAVGDRVYGLIPGNFGNYVRSPALNVQKMSEGDRFEDVASTPVSYMTAVYAFMHLARLTKGESVLIQSATGGLGLAALSIAKHAGADVFATVGTEDKIKVLTEEFGIPRNRIFNSRKVSATADIMEATGGKGVDVILCSAAGDMMHEMWRCIAPLGRFIEVGRTDVIDRGQLNLEIFQRNATFSSFDLGLMNQQKPELVAG